ncbi:FDLD family class I lanthipeptide [Allokutzneria albata]|uniref:Uncharacterized protein n=1 Tax=Allokutzneria albata TaxID=211114 RepID=A0A1G9V5S8_ALLAB|nr:FDLD family class I lanthipeptide [Allokutzneria albata]SDM67416.1 hypothetical protein SAMN04489726_2842 [Allokutzneria albata]
MNPDQAALDQFDLDVRVVTPGEQHDVEPMTFTQVMCSLRCTIYLC